MQDFSICAMCRFTVEHKGEYSYNTPTYEIPNDWHTEKYKYKRILDFNEIIHIFQNELKSNDLFSIHVHNNCIIFDHFNPNNGESRTYSYKITHKQENKFRALKGDINERV